VTSRSQSSLNHVLYSRTRRDITDWVIKECVIAINIIMIIITPLTMVKEDQWGFLECLHKACQAAITDGGLFTDNQCVIAINNLLRLEFPNIFHLKTSNISWNINTLSRTELSLELYHSTVERVNHSTVLSWVLNCIIVVIITAVCLLTHFTHIMASFYFCVIDCVIYRTHVITWSSVGSLVTSQ